MYIHTDKNYMSTDHNMMQKISKIWKPSSFLNLLMNGCTYVPTLIRTYLLE